jgi:polyferredoxin
MAAVASALSRNLLDIPGVRTILRSRWFPAIFAYPTLVVFGYIVYALLFGPGAASANLGTTLTWVLWWPLLPLMMFALGRFWCAICPFATVIDTIQKLAGLGRPVAPLLKRYGIWIIDATFILITWADHVFGIVESPRGSGYLLAGLVTASVVTAVFYERRAWCRFLCFLGGLSGNYSRSAGIALRATPDICVRCKTQSCYRGDGRLPGCPVFEFPRTMMSSANCNLCANCIKVCPNDSIRLRPRAPTSELWFMSRPRFEESFLAAVIVGIVLVQNVTMLSFWRPVMDSVTHVLVGSRTLAFTAIFAAAMAIPFGAMMAAARLSGAASGESVSMNFARFGYAVIPLDLAGHVAHNLFHLLSEGKAVVFNAAALVDFHVTGSAELVSPDTVRMLQFAIIALGIAGSLYTATRIAERPGSAVPRLRTLMPHAAVLVLFGFVNVYLFTLPMVHRV